MPKPILLLALLSLALSGCFRDCGWQEEPLVHIEYSGPKTFRSVSALGARDLTAFEPLPAPKPGSDSSYHRTSYSFPLSLLADSTTYLFFSDTRVDTLTIHYQRYFYPKRGCDFVAKIRANWAKQVHSSTFKEVTVEFYDYYPKVSIKDF
ncbi:hypothetical protein GCM10027275_29820 [Rhabdobacter roseus]|uniref:Lipoprotein n=1 Tax=Rhabdobacter roseus TaxID=1655419 RepID=A0A840TTE3_9BACT|nr:hypothetical protein [Rhabdobacter roseus]MBB5284937.1 hypothetical protein [Rhabdobacter roseus]